MSDMDDYGPVPREPRHRYHRDPNRGGVLGPLGRRRKKIPSILSEPQDLLGVDIARFKISRHKKMGVVEMNVGDKPVRQKKVVPERKVVKSEVARPNAQREKTIAEDWGVLPENDDEGGDQVHFFSEDTEVKPKPSVMSVGSDYERITSRQKAKHYLRVDAEDYRSVSAQKSAQLAVAQRVAEKEQRMEALKAGLFQEVSERLGMNQSSFDLKNIERKKKKKKKKAEKSEMEKPQKIEEESPKKTMPLREELIRKGIVKVKSLNPEKALLEKDTFEAHQNRKMSVLLNPGIVKAVVQNETSADLGSPKRFSEDQRNSVSVIPDEKNQNPVTGAPVQLRVPSSFWNRDGQDDSSVSPERSEAVVGSQTARAPPPEKAVPIQPGSMTERPLHTQDVEGIRDSDMSDLSEITATGKKGRGRKKRKSAAVRHLSISPRTKMSLSVLKALDGIYPLEEVAEELPTTRRVRHLYAKGTILYNQGDIQVARRYFKQAVDLSNQLLGQGTLSHRAQALLDVEAYEKALKEADKILAEKRYSLRHPKRYALKQDKKYYQNARAYLNGLKANPADPEFQNGFEQSLEYIRHERPFRPTRPPPQVTSVQPHVGGLQGDTGIVIRGRDFLDEERSATVLINDRKCTGIRIISGHQIYAVTPPSSSAYGGVCDVQVQLENGQKSHPDPRAKFSYGPPVIEEIDPPEGSQNGGNKVRIRGQRLGVKKIQLTVDGMIVEQSRIKFIVTNREIELTMPRGVTAGNKLVQIQVGKLKSKPHAHSHYNYIAEKVITIVRRPDREMKQDDEDDEFKITIDDLVKKDEDPEASLGRAMDCIFENLERLRNIFRFYCLDGPMDNAFEMNKRQFRLLIDRLNVVDSKLLPQAALDTIFVRVTRAQHGKPKRDTLELPHFVEALCRIANIRFKSAGEFVFRFSELLQTEVFPKLKEIPSQKGFLTDLCRSEVQDVIVAYGPQLEPVFQKFAAMNQTDDWAIKHRLTMDISELMMVVKGFDFIDETSMITVKDIERSFTISNWGFWPTNRFGQATSMKNDKGHPLKDRGELSFEDFEEVIARISLLDKGIIAEESSSHREPLEVHLKEFLEKMFTRKEEEDEDTLDKPTKRTRSSSVVPDSATEEKMRNVSELIPEAGEDGEDDDDDDEYDMHDDEDGESIEAIDEEEKTVVKPMTGEGPGLLVSALLGPGKNAAAAEGAAGLMKLNDAPENKSDDLEPSGSDRVYSPVSEDDDEVMVQAKEKALEHMVGSFEIEEVDGELNDDGSLNQAPEVDEDTTQLTAESQQQPDAPGEE